MSTALPTLGRVFNDASIESWVGTAYLLTSTACQPLYGRLSDIFGRKVVLLSSLGFFLIGSILSAVSTSMVMLIVFRAYHPFYRVVFIYNNPRLRSHLGYRWWRYSYFRHDHCLRCGVSRETRYLPGYHWCSGCSIELDWAPSWWNLHRESYLEMVLCKFM